MSTANDTSYYRHNIATEDGYHRPISTPISMSETLTLRDQFAMAALTGYCAYSGYVGQDPAFRAHYAYKMADAMLAAREEKK